FAIDTDGVADVLVQFACGTLAGLFRGALVVTFYVHYHFSHTAGAAQFDLEVRSKTSTFEDLLFNLSGEDVDPAQNDHVIAAASNFFHAPHGAGCAWHQTGQIPGAVTDHGQSLFGERSKD